MKVTNKNEAKTLVKHISCDCKWNFIGTTCNSNQKWNKETCQCECKSYCTCKKNYSLNPCTCICKNGNIKKVLLMIQKLCVMKLYVMDIV